MSIDEQIEELKKRVRIAQTQLEDVRLIKRKQDARAFIVANNITLKDVELCSGKEKPWFGHVHAFAEWLRTHSTKNFAEWNTVIYRTSDLLAGRMPEMPATIDDLKEYKR